MTTQTGDLIDFKRIGAGYGGLWAKLHANGSVTLTRGFDGVTLTAEEWAQTMAWLGYTKKEEQEDGPPRTH